MRRKEFLGLCLSAATAGAMWACSSKGPGAPSRRASSGGTRVSVKVYELRLKQAWGLSRGTWTSRRNAFVEIERDGIVGLGEAAPIARYNETAESAAAFIERARPALDRDLLEYVVARSAVEAVGPGEHAAKAALDMAVLDWVGKRLNVPTWKLLGLGRVKDITTTYSIGIDEVPVMQEKVRAAADFPVYKIKVGTPDDRKILEGIRAVTDKPLRVDANEGWKTKEGALERIRWMAGLGVELVEQPLPADRLEDSAWLKERSPIPVFADESVLEAADLVRIAPYFHGVNIKLMKCGGLQEALRLAGLARGLGLKIMIGCMIESSLGISAGAAVASLFDYVDLDGNLLIANDPFRGVRTVGGRILLSDAPGLGVEGGIL